MGVIVIRLARLLPAPARATALGVGVFATLIGSAALQAETGAGTSAQPRQADGVVYRLADEGGPRRFRLAGNDERRLYEFPSTDAPVVANVSSGAILVNLGCAMTADRVWCRVQPLRAGTRGFVPGEFLVPAVGPDGAIAAGADDSSRRARRGDFDARESVRCAQVRGQTLGTCSARVARGGGGDAAVVVTFANGFARTLYFAHGVFISANATMSGVGTDTDWTMENGLHFVRVEDQRYEIPDALIVDVSAGNR